MAGPTRERGPGTRLRADFGVAWGLLAGAGVGTLLLALTGTALWLAIGPVIGLAVGIAVSALGTGHEDDANAHEEDPVP